MRTEIKLMQYNLLMEKGSEHESKAYSFERVAKVTLDLNDKREIYVKALTELLNAQTAYQEAEKIDFDGVKFDDATKAIARCESVKSNYLAEHNKITTSADKNPETM